MMKLRLILLLIILALVSVQAKDNNSSAFDSYVNAFSNYQANSNNFDAIYEFAEASFHVGQTKQALELIKVLHDQRINDPKALLLDSEILISLRRYDEAGLKLGLILELYPHSPFASSAHKLEQSIPKKNKNLISNYIGAVKLGFDSNPIMMNKDITALNNFLRLDDNLSQSVFFTDGQLPGADIFTEVSFQGDYLHDFGQQGDWFAVYDWSFYGKAYASQSPLNTFAIKAGSHLGYVTPKRGQVLLGVDLGYLDSNIVNDVNTSTSGNYFFFSFKAEYNYKLGVNSLFTFKYTHEDYGSTETYPYLQPIYDQNVYLYDETRYHSVVSHSVDGITLQIEGPIFTRGYYFFRPFYSMLNTDTQYPQLIPTLYSHYNETGIEIGFDYSLNSRINLKTVFYGSHKYYEEAYLPVDSSFTLGFPLYPGDPNYYRIDEFGSLSFEVSFQHSKDYTSSLKYAYSQNRSKYTPAEYNKHELVYAFYWKP